MYDSLEIIQRQNYKSIPTSLGCFYFLNRFLLDLEYSTVAPYSIFFCKLCCDHNASEFVCCTKEYYIYILSRNISSIKEWDTRRPPTLSWTSLLGSSPGHMQSGRRSQIWSRKLKGLKAICSYLFYSHNQILETEVLLTLQFPFRNFDRCLQYSLQLEIDIFEYIFDWCI